MIPDLCNDMHDCGVATGDAWACAHLDPYARYGLPPLGRAAGASPLPPR
ncbi:hypothetical protein [Dactylosporangium sp. CS-033363]